MRFRRRASRCPQHARRPSGDSNRPYAAWVAAAVIGTASRSALAAHVERAATSRAVDVGARLLHGVGIARTPSVRRLGVKAACGRTNHGQAREGTEDIRKHRVRESLHHHTAPSRHVDRPSGRWARHSTWPPHPPTTSQWSQAGWTRRFPISPGVPGLGRYRCKCSRPSSNAARECG